MADNTGNLTWSSWTRSTKIVVGVMLFFAAAVVVVLYLPR
jgi:type IV secretory pathway VirB2 component (pilin)